MGFWWWIIEMILFLLMIRMKMLGFWSEWRCWVSDLKFCFFVVLRLRPCLHHCMLPSFVAFSFFGWFVVFCLVRGISALSPTLFVFPIFRLCLNFSHLRSHVGFWLLFPFLRDFALKICEFKNEFHESSGDNSLLFLCLVLINYMLLTWSVLVPDSVAFFNFLFVWQRN